MNVQGEVRKPSKVFAVVLHTRFDAETLEGIYADKDAAEQEAMILNAEYSFDSDFTSGYHFTVKPMGIK